MSKHDWHYINSKLTPKCCLGRGFDYIHDSKCADSDSIQKWSCLALECSLLGVYEHADRRPCFAQRLRVHKFMNDDMDKDALFQFQINYDALVLFAEREFMITQIKYCRALYETICSLYDGWQAFERSVLSTMDVVRHIFSETGSLQEATDAIVRLSTNDKPRVYRQQTTDFIKYLAAQLQAVDEKMFMESENPRGCVIDETLIPDEQRIRIDQFVESMTPGQTVHLEWLQSFGLDARALRILYKCQKIFEATSSDMSIRDILPHLSAVQYSVVGYFSRQFLRHSSMRVMDVDIDMYRSQMRAVRKRYGLAFDDPLPRQAGVFYYAPCCQQVKSFLPDTDIRVAYGQVRIIYDDEHNRLLCGRKSDRNDTKKRGNKQLRARNSKRREPEKVIRKKEFKALQKAKGNVSCLSTDVVRVPLLGRMIEIDTVKNKDTQGPFTLCAQCGFITPFTMSRYHTNGFMCGLCIEQECEVAQQPFCFACRNTAFSPGTTFGPKTEQKFHLHCLLDDLPEGDMTFRYMWLCTTCNKPWVQKSSGMLLCSDILRGLRDYRHSDNFFEFFQLK